MIEAAEQRDVVKWFRGAYPEHAKSLRVSQGGGHRGSRRQAAIRTAKAKGQGMVVGEADIVILLPRGGYGSLVVEHKGEGQPHKLSDAQIEYLEYHNANGNLAISTRGIEPLMAAIDVYMSKTPGPLKGFA